MIRALLVCLVLSTSVAAADNVLRWQPYPDADDQIALMRDGKHLGTWSYKYQKFMTKENGTWGRWVNTPPIPAPPRGEHLPAATLDLGEDWRTTGVQTEMIAQAPKFSICGKDATCTEVDASFASVPDDRKSPNLTVIGGTKDQRDKVKNDLDTNPALTPYKGKVKFNAYEPTNPLIADMGYKTDGNPTIYIQQGPKVLHRQDDYTGPECAEKLAEAIRKAQPDYDPAKDPNLNKPPPATPLTLDGLLQMVKSMDSKDWTLTGVVGVVLALLAKAPKTKETPRV